MKKRYKNLIKSFVCINLMALIPGIGFAANSCPTEKDPFYISVTAKGEGAHYNAALQASLQKMMKRADQLALELGLNPTRGMVAGLTHVNRMVTTDESELPVTITLASWFYLDISGNTIQSMPINCIGSSAKGIIEEYDMDDYWLNH
ncbi:MAG: hypothetical protein QNL62_07440 [Gammaproteobacteria bacterium]|nr:hypothetical protein [Gammaproteobacteria bacterium]